MVTLVPTYPVLSVLVVVLVICLAVLLPSKTPTILALGNNGTCSCRNFCARNWGNSVTDGAPDWQGAKCVNAWIADENTPTFKIVEKGCSYFQETLPAGQILACECAEDTGPFYPIVSGQCNAPLVY